MPEFVDADAKVAEAKARKQAERDKYPLPEAIGGREWGPFYNLQHVATDFGEFGVPRGKVLYFVMGTKRFPDGHHGPSPVEMYRDATEAEMAQADRVWADMKKQMQEAS